MYAVRRERRGDSSVDRNLNSIGRLAESEEKARGRLERAYEMRRRFEI